MTRVPPSPDEELLLVRLPPAPNRPGPTTVRVNIWSTREDPYVERIILKELAVYLHHPFQQLKKLAASWGALGFIWVKNPKKRVWWVTPNTAQRLIIYARAKQGEVFHKGINYHAFIETWRRKNVKQWAKKKAAKLG